MQSDDPSVRALVGHIVPIVQRCESMTVSDARSGIFGLQGLYSGNSREVADLFDALAELLERSNNSFAVPGEAANVLYGMQGLDLSTLSGRKMVRVVNKMIKGLPDSAQFTGREMAMSMYGLRNAKGNSAEALNLIDTLSVHMQRLRGQLSANDVATILFGLQNARTFFKPVLAFIDALGLQMDETRGNFNSRGLSMALNGLQGVSSDSQASRRLFSQLVPIMQRTKPYFRGFDDFHQLALALYGLNAMKTDNEETKLLLTELAELLRLSSATESAGDKRDQKPRSSKSSASGYHVSLGLRQPETPTTEKVAMALYGLQVQYLSFIK